MCRIIIFIHHLKISPELLIKYVGITKVRRAVRAICLACTPCPVKQNVFSKEKLGLLGRKMEINPPQWGTALGLYKTAKWAEHLIFKSLKEIWAKTQGNNTEWQRDGTFSSCGTYKLTARTQCALGISSFRKRGRKSAKSLGMDG